MRCRIILLLVLSGFGLFATHNMSGVITWQHLGGFQYKFTIKTLTDISGSGSADRCKLTLYINGGVDSVLFLRVNGPNNNPPADCAGTMDGVEISLTSKLNVYEGTYTFPCKGKFKVNTYDPNRNAGIVNIPNSVNQPFYIESEIVIPDLMYTCTKNSPTVELNKIQIALLPNQKFYPLSLNSYGDSLDYSLVPCQGTDQVGNIGASIPGYTSAGFTIHPKTGEITANPGSTGQYNLCVKIKMFRNQEYIGSVNYDLSVYVINTPAFTYSTFTTNLTPVNGIFQLNSSQTLSVSGDNTNSTNCYYSLTSEFTGQTTSLSVNTSTFSFAVTYSASLARNEFYKLYISGRNLTPPGMSKDTLIRVQFLGAPSNTCGVMAITTTTCLASIKENTKTDFEFELYPSITSNDLHLKGEYKNLELMDVSGKILRPIMTQENLMNVENLSSGVYILSVTDPDNRLHYYKFVKN